MTAGLESRFKQIAFSRLCPKVSGFKPCFFGSLELLQDYLKIAMESKNEPNHNILNSTAYPADGTVPPSANLSNFPNHCKTHTNFSSCWPPQLFACGDLTRISGTTQQCKPFVIVFVEKPTLRRLARLYSCLALPRGRFSKGYSDARAASLC
jgi:hypothetical protein